MDRRSEVTTLTSDNLPCPKCVPDMYIRLRDLTKYQRDLNELHVHLFCNFAIARHNVQQGRRQRIEKSFSDEHAAEIVLGCRALQFEDAADTVQGVDNKIHLFGVVFIEKVNKNLQASATIK